MTLAKYQVKYDPVLQRKLEIAHVLFRWIDWAKYLAGLGIRGTLFAVIFWFVFSLFAEIPSRGFVAGIVVGFVLSVIAGFSQLLRDLKLKRFFDRGQLEWICSLQDEGWSFTDNYGFSRTYPWKEMKMLFVHNDAWLISIRGEDIWVYRESLKVAGYDQFFEEKLVANLK